MLLYGEHAMIVQQNQLCGFCGSGKEYTDVPVTCCVAATSHLVSPVHMHHAHPHTTRHADELHPSVEKEELERYPKSSAAFNIGIMMFRPNSRQFVSEW